MRERRIEYDGILTPTRIGGDLEQIDVVFDTERFGYYRIECQVEDDQVNLKELSNEPPIEVFTNKEQRYIRRVCAIVWRMIFDAPAATNRFDR